MPPIRSLIRQALVFGIVWAAGLAAVHALKRIAVFNAPFFWPMSIFRPRWPSAAQWLTLAAAAVLFALAQRWSLWRRNRLTVLLVGSLLVLLANLGQGWPEGLARPIAGEHAGETIQYYHDAVKLPGAMMALRGFDTLQPTLSVHSRSHPPGTLFLFRVLLDLLGSPTWIGLCLALVALLLAGIHLESFLSRFLPPERARLGLWLFLLLPAVQIYFAVSLDALIAALFVAVMTSFRPERSWFALLPALLYLGLAASLTFAVLFLPPVLAWVEWRQQRNISKTLALGVALALVLTALGALLGFNYWQAFLTASRLENPQGFWLVADPLSYLATRIEDVAEILLFFGPFALTLAWTGLRSGKGHGGIGPWGASCPLDCCSSAARSRLARLRASASS